MNAEAILRRLGEYADVRGYAGYDPYDTLNSPLSGVLSLGTRWGRIALTQFGRRCPINLRPLLLVRPGVNPKALALFLEGYARLCRVDADPVWLERMDKLVGMLAAARSPDITGNGWGYNFPWQNRFQCLPRHTPTIVNSAFAGHALLDCFEAAGNESARELACAIPQFMLNELNRKSEGDAFCFSYTPLDRNFVHNANMFGASLLARLAVQYDRPELLDPALASLAYSIKHQHDDGSWAYAETAAQNWIDSFHTGFNLEALRRFLKLGLAAEYREAYVRGREFYAGHFFLSDGAPRYYHDRLYPVDIHAPAEAVSFFSGEGAEFAALTECVLHWMLNHMYDEKDGIFYFRRTPHFTIRIPYMRWSEAWAFRALAYYNVADKTQTESRTNHV